MNISTRKGGPFHPMARTRQDDEPIQIVDARKVPLQLDPQVLEDVARMGERQLLVLVLVLLATYNNVDVKSYVHEYREESDTEIDDYDWKCACEELIQAGYLVPVEVSGE